MSSPFETINDRRLAFAIEKQTLPNYVAEVNDTMYDFLETLKEQEIFNLSFIYPSSLSSLKEEKKEEKKEDEKDEEKDELLDSFYLNSLESLYSSLNEIFTKVTRYEFALEVFTLYVNEYEEKFNSEQTRDLFVYSLTSFLKDSKEKVAKTYKGFINLVEQHNQTQALILEDASKKLEERVKLRETLDYYYNLNSYDWKEEIVSFYAVYDVEALDKELSAHALFNKAKVSYDIPFIVLNYGDLHHYKILKGDQVNYDTVTTLGKTAERFFKSSPYNITFNVYIGPKEKTGKDYYNIPENSLVKCIWDLEKGKLLIKSSASKDSGVDMIKLIKTAFDIKIEKSFKYVNITMEFSALIEKSVDPAYLIPFISSNPSYSSYFYIDESRRPYCESTLNYIYFDYDSNLGESKKPRATINLSKDKELVIRIISSNVEVAKRCHNFFTSLFNSFLYHYKTIFAYYSNYLIAESKEEFKDKGKKVKLSTFFGSNYSRKLCSSGGAPKLILDEKELKEYEKTVYDGTNPIKRDIQHINEWAETDINAYLVCADPKHPYMVTKFIEETGKEVPCCGTNPRDRVLKRDKQAQNVVKTFKIVNKDVEGIISVLPQINGFTKITRLGVVGITNDSFLHCVSRALFTNDYKKDPVKTVAKMRDRLIKETYPPLYKQSLYYLKDSEIKQKLEDVNTYFDPLFFYRGIEELYDVNVYIFENNNRTGEIIPILPSFASVYCKPYVERNCICILRNSGTEQVTKYLPQCELLVGPERSTIFNKEVSKNLWTYLSDKYLQIYQPSTLANVYRNVFSYKDLNKVILSLKGVEFVGQILDSYGHARIFNYKMKGKGFSAVLPPSQPVNAPMAKDVYFTTQEEAIKLFGSPSAITVKDKKCIGLWFPALGLNNLIFVLTKEENKYDQNLPILSSDYHLGISKNYNNNYETTKAQANIYTTLINSCLNLYLKEGGEKKDFLDLLKVEKVDYDFNIFKTRKYPKAETLKEYLKLLSVLVPSFTNGTYIKVSSTKFLERLRFHILSYIPSPTSEEPISLFSRSANFDQSNSLTFTQEDYEYWHINRKQLGYRISNNEEFLVNSLYPYLISTSNKKLYIVQNVENYNFYRALDTGLHFLATGIIDTTCPKISDESKVCPYQVFSYDGSKLILLQDEANNEKNFIYILSYNNILRDEKDGRFALLVPIT
jgi:hypothetical protein